MTSLDKSLTRIMETQNLACSFASSKPRAAPTGIIKVPRIGRLMLRIWILKTECVTGGAGDAAGGAFELVFYVALVLGVSWADGVGIRRERVEREGRDRVAVGGVEIHVLGEPVRVEEVIARPAFGQFGQLRGVEIHGHFVARAEDHVLVV